MKTTANNNETKKMTLDEEMALWEARANDEFGTTLKEIEKAAAEYFCAEPDENGILSTPMSQLKALYSLDGNRKSIAKSATAILEDWEVLEDKSVKVLVKKLNKLAA